MKQKFLLELLTLNVDGNSDFLEHSESQHNYFECCTRRGKQYH